MNVNLAYKQIIAIVMVAGIFSSCQKKDETPPQPDQVHVTINTPTENQEFAPGDTVWVNAHVSYVSQLHGYELKITDSESGAELYEYEAHTHGSEFDISQYWVNTLATKRKLKLEIETVIDHESNTAHFERTFQTKP
jgi:hypothetical protein